MYLNFNTSCSCESYDFATKTNLKMLGVLKEISAEFKAELYSSMNLMN